jgi:hypothetical protein
MNNKGRYILRQIGRGTQPDEEQAQEEQWIRRLKDQEIQRQEMLGFAQDPDDHDQFDENAWDNELERIKKETRDWKQSVAQQDNWSEINHEAKGRKILQQQEAQKAQKGEAPMTAGAQAAAIEGVIKTVYKNNQMWIYLTDKNIEDVEMSNIVKSLETDYYHLVDFRQIYPPDEVESYICELYQDDELPMPDDVAEMLLDCPLTANELLEAVDVIEEYEGVDDEQHFVLSLFKATYDRS